LDRYLAVMAGAAVGGLLRYAVVTGVTERFVSRFPLGTLVVNVTGCFLIGLIMTILTERVVPHRNWNLFLVSGILGGYTTFSAFGWETFQAARMGGHAIALANVVLSCVAGYLAVWLGVVVAARR
jgi:CrcB protein